MTYIMGIDTGGTYTDSVILDLESGTVITKAKAFTTHDNLSHGINNSINFLKFKKFHSISRVVISTTLATNAIVEEKGHKTGLILIGKKLKESTPAASTYNVQGCLNAKGRELCPINPNEIISIISSLNRQHIDTVAICGFLSVRNPIHEKEIENIIRKNSDMSIVCSHKITADLGFLERAITSVLNASLMPIIEDFIEAINSVLKNHNIVTLPYIVKCDGSIATIDSIREIPIETILSGPVASVIGAMHLSGQKNAIIADMGGTTTDTVLIEDNRVSMAIKGAKIGNWQTLVKSIAVSTYGLGGDSKIDYKDGKFILGPQRVLPSCRQTNQTSDKFNVTPTDILHFTGEFCRWDCCASRKSVSTMAVKANMSDGKFAQDSSREIIRILYNQCIVPYSKSDIPVVAIGAPADIWFRKAADAFGFKIIIPENYEVANAIGAAVAVIRESTSAIIRSGENHQGFIVHFQEKRMVFSNISEAIEYSDTELREEAYCKAKKQGACSIEISITKKDIKSDWIDNKGKKREIFVEMIITAVAVGYKI